MNVKELKPSEKGEIIWLSKSGYSPEAVAREMRLPLNVIQAFMGEKASASI